VYANPPGFADNFADRDQIVGFTNYISGNNTTFTKEPGERDHGGIASRRSAWISWRAPANGVCTVDVLGSSFDTILAVYTGAQMNGLVPISFNDDADAKTLQSRTVFNALQDAVYQIVVDEFGTFGNGGNINFHLSLARNTPIIVTSPQSQSIPPGSSLMLSVVASGPGTLSYQWQRNGLDLPGQNHPMLTISDTKISDVGIYTVVVSNNAGSTLSRPAVISLRSAPIIVTHPASQVAFPGNSVTLRVDAAGTSPLSYQWRFNGIPIAGATSPSLTLNNVVHMDGGFYNVSIVNSVGSTISRPAELIVTPEIVQIAVPEEGSFRFVYHVTPGFRYAVEASTNFTNWIEITNFLHATQETEFLDSNTSQNAHRFYQLRRLP